MPVYRTQRNSAEAGFTLLELLVVLALASLMASAAILWVPGMGDRMAVAKTADKIERLLSGAEMAAVRSGSDRQVTLDMQSNRYLLVATDKTLEIDPSVIVRWVSAAEAGSGSLRGAIAFFGTGGSSGGRIEVRRGSFLVAVEVDWLTGKVRRPM